MAIGDPKTRPRTRGPLARRGAGDRRGPLDRSTTLYDEAALPGGGGPPPPRGDWRSEIIGLSGLNVLAGIWLIIAPWVLGYSAKDPRWNDVVFGIIVGILALIRVMGAYRAEVLSLVNALIGAWLVVAAFTIDYSIRASWNDVILGVIVFLLAVSSADASAHLPGRRRTGTR